MNSDYLEYPDETDNNVHTKMYHSAVLPDLVNVALPNRTANAMSTSVRWKKAKAWFESRADPGGIKGTKIQRHHHDPDQIHFEKANPESAKDRPELTNWQIEGTTRKEHD